VFYRRLFNNLNERIKLTGLLVGFFFGHFFPLFLFSYKMQARTLTHYARLHFRVVRLIVLLKQLRELFGNDAPTGFHFASRYRYPGYCHQRDDPFLEKKTLLFSNG